MCQPSYAFYIETWDIEFIIQTSIWMSFSDPIEIYSSDSEISFSDPIDAYSSDRDMPFSDPIDLDSSDAESFNEDDMYGMDDAMETISQSSDESDDDISQSDNSMV
jgi:hypothetical protein